MQIEGKQFVRKGWGYENIIVNKPLYCGKILHVDKGKRCSFHYHKLKDETFYILKGVILLEFGETDNIDNIQTIQLEFNQSFYINPGLRHRFTAREDSDILEISTEHFDDDSIR